MRHPIVAQEHDDLAAQPKPTRAERAFRAEVARIRGEVDRRSPPMIWLNLRVWLTRPQFPQRASEVCAGALVILVLLLIVAGD